MKTETKRKFQCHGEQKENELRTLSTFLFDQSELDACHADMMELLRNHMSELSQLKAVSGKRKAIETHLDGLVKKHDVLGKLGIQAKTSVLSGDEGVPPKAIHEIDLQLVCNSTCGATHSLNIELCVSNREAIGTNFLKLEVFSATNPNLTHLGVLLCPDRKFYKESNMDPSYGDDDEHIISHQLSYHNVLESRLVVLTLGD